MWLMLQPPLPRGKSALCSRSGGWGCRRKIVAWLVLQWIDAPTGHGIDAPTGHRIPAKGNALGKTPRPFLRSVGTPHIAAQPIRDRPSIPSIPFPGLHLGLVCHAPLGLCVVDVAHASTASTEGKICFVLQIRWMRMLERDCGMVSSSMNWCPNGAPHTSEGQRPGKNTPAISAFCRNAADRRFVATAPQGIIGSKWCGAAYKKTSLTNVFAYFYY